MVQKNEIKIKLEFENMLKSIETESRYGMIYLSSLNFLFSLFDLFENRVKMLIYYILRH